jgi:ketosteroid isomerase-like protein
VEFAEAVDRHLATITERDLTAYLATVHDDVTLIMPNGRLVEGKPALATFTGDWFGDLDWTWHLSPVHTTAADDTGVALFTVDYHDVDAAGQPYQLRYLLGLTFTRQNGVWLLLHDQNTLTT